LATGKDLLISGHFITQMGGFFLLAFAQTGTIEKEEIEMPEEHERLVAFTTGYFV
jgi:hypothetical protein